MLAVQYAPLINSERHSVKADSLRIAKVFSGGGDVQYVLPHFQREYAWDRTNWQTLLDDVFKIYDEYTDERVPEHFMGALVVVDDGTKSGTLPIFKLVDGQQRLTTISLALCALSALVKEASPVLQRKIRRMLENEDETHELHYKLLPTLKNRDREKYMAVIDGRKSDDDSATTSRIDDAYNFFVRQLRARLANGTDPERLYLVFVNCLHVVFINLDKQERPYEIFESLNAKGKPLTQPDLIRNYIAMMISEKEQAKAFEAWTKIEQLLDENRFVSRIGELTAFTRHYLAYRTGILASQEHVYARFRDRMQKENLDSHHFVSEIETMRQHAVAYNRFLRPEHEPDREIRDALERLAIIESVTSYPLLLTLFDSYREGQISKTLLIECLNLVENYFIRRWMAGESTQYPTKMFPNIIREINFHAPADSLRQILLTRNYPSDSRIRDVALTRNMYGRDNKTLIFILNQINRSLSQGSGGYTILDGAATLEHILPQTLTPTWKNALGDDSETTHRDQLHTLGNLTLVTQDWNSSLSNGSFDDKLAQFRRHGLRLNSDYFAEDLQVWDADAIRTRSAWLTKRIFELWPAFGEPPVQITATYESPTALVVRGEIFEVTSWRALAQSFVEYVIREQLMPFERFVRESGTTQITEQERDRTKQLSNGWWFYVSISRSTSLDICNKIASTLDFSDDDWQIITNLTPPA